MNIGKLRFDSLSLAGLALATITVACGGSDASIPSQGASSPGSSAEGTSPPPPGSDTETSPTVPGTAPSTSNACDGAGREICARACACAGDGKCRIGVDVDAGIPATINFKNEAACLDFFLLRCGASGEPPLDYAACQSDVKAAACVAPPGGGAVLMPASCRPRS